MHKFSTFILGGARSGKSSFGEKLALDSKLKPIYIATAEAFDDEMKDRIRHHQNSRSGRGWQTVEEPTDIVQCIKEYAGPEHIIFIDCLTLWLSNLMLEGLPLKAHISALLAALSEARGPVILVSNEVGMGIVPENKLGRHFRDEAGRMNQKIAAAVPNCYFIIAGLPLPLKKAGRTIVEGFSE